jgi:hypothetical protein
MQTLTDVFAFIAGTPAIVGPVLTAALVFLTSNWRLSLIALLFQYSLVALALSRFVRPEVAVVKALVGVLVVLILYITAQNKAEARGLRATEGDRPQRLGLHLGWLDGPLGLPLRLLAIVLMALALIRLFENYSLTLVPADIAFVACWLAGTGVLGLILSAEPLRAALALLTFLTGFDLAFADLEPSLALVGFWGALTLMASLALSYLAAVQGLAASPVGSDEEDS